MANKENVIKEKSYDFALDVVKVYKTLTMEQREFVLSKLHYSSSLFILK